MKISLSTKQFFDLEGKPLSAGRVSVFVHDSNVAVPLYVYEGSAYVPAQNPYILDDAGRCPGLWFEAASVDVKVEKYNGVPGSYSQVAEFTDGFTMPDVRNDTIVYGISGLEQANTALGSVTVVGFNGPADCGPRSYVWDALASEQEDGCAIVRSQDVPGDGRWILVASGKYMPSEYYGIVPGSSEANISAFLSYPEHVGQWGISLPPVPLFAPGTYTSQGGFSSNKVVSFQKGAKFTDADFYLPGAEVEPGSDYVAEFFFSSPQASAHSSWFRTPAGFLSCDATTLFIDSDNYFVDSKLYLPVTVERATIIGTKRMAITYATGAYIKLSRCNLAATEILSPSQDYVKFASCGWQDEIWNSTTPSHFDFGRISNGNHIEFLGVAMCNRDISQFSSTMTYFRMREAELALGESTNTILDMQGRSLSTFNSQYFSKLMNCRVTGNVTLTSAPSGFVMENVEVEGQIDGGTNPVCINVIGKWNTEWTGSLNCSNCILSGAKVTGAHDITFVGGRWEKSIENASDNITDTGTVIFRDCVLDGMSTKIHTKNLNLIRCGVYEQDIKIYPVWNSASSVFLFQGRIEDCEISGSTPIAYGIFHGLGDNCKDCVLIYSWIGNSFFGNTDGMTFEFWADSTVLAEVLARSGHSVVYSGNKGYCPLEAWHGTYGPTSWGACAFYPADGDPTSPLGNFYRAAYAVRCCPPWNGTISNAGTYGNWMGASYQISGGASTKGYSAATNPLPASLGYGDAFGSYFVRYGGTGDTALIYV